MVDIDAAIGYVVAHGDPVERARLSFLLNDTVPPPHVVERITAGQATEGGWPATGDSNVPSIDATCFRFAELDDLGALHGPAVDDALSWLTSRQGRNGSWQEYESLAHEAPPWAMPGDPEATFYLTAVAGFWLAVAGNEARPYPGAPNRFASHLEGACRYLIEQFRPDGTWPSFLAAGWHAAGLLHEQQHFYESARVQLVLGDRLGDLSSSDAGSMAATLRRLDLGDDWLLGGARKRLGETQRRDGGWDSDEGPIFDVNATLTAIRAVIERRRPTEQ